MNGDVYRGSDSGEVLRCDGERAYAIDVLELMGGHGVSWPGPSNGDRQLACSLLYDALGWVQTADVCARLERDITSATYLPHQKTAMGGVPMSDVQVERSGRRARSLTISCVAYAGPHGAQAFNVAASELDVVLLDERAPRELVERLRAMVPRGIRVDEAARASLVEHLRGSRPAP